MATSELRHDVDSYARQTCVWLDGQFELTESETALLVEITHTLDLLADLQKTIDRDGVMVVKDFESARCIRLWLDRAQRIALTRLVSTSATVWSD